MTSLSRILLAPLAVCGVAALLGAFVSPAVGPFYSKVMIDVCIAIVLAVSLNIVNGYTGQFSIGHGGFMAVGGYVGGWLTYYGGILFLGGPGPHGGVAGALTFFGATVVGGLAAAVAGFVVGLPSLRLRGDYLALVTLGFGEIVRVIITQTEDVAYNRAEILATPIPQLLPKVGGALGFTGLPFYTSLGWAAAWCGVVVVVAARLKRSSHGLAMLAVREDEVAAGAMGIHTTRSKVLAFVLAAFFAGVAGVLFSHEIGTTLNPRELGFQKSFEVVIMVVLGGMGSLSGSVVAAIGLTVLPELLREFSQYRMIVYALLLVVVMIVRPKGLFGVAELWDLPPFRRKKGGK